MHFTLLKNWSGGRLGALDESLWGLSSILNKNPTGRDREATFLLFTAALRI